MGAPVRVKRAQMHLTLVSVARWQRRCARAARRGMLCRRRRPRWRQKRARACSERARVALVQRRRRRHARRVRALAAAQAAAKPFILVACERCASEQEWVWQVLLAPHQQQRHERSSTTRS